jgi:hypothetical protein
MAANGRVRFCSTFLSVKAREQAWNQGRALGIFYAASKFIRIINIQPRGRRVWSGVRPWKTPTEAFI